MRPETKVAGFVIALVAIFGAAAGVGAITDPDSAKEPVIKHDDPAHGGSAEAADHEMDTGQAAMDIPGGLMVSENGYTLELLTDRAEAGESVPVRFAILGPNGERVRDYTEEHGKDLHLIVVRRDLSGYQHVHPVLDSDGVWSTEADLSAPGDYRVYADFTPTGGDPLTLGADLAVPGEVVPHELPVASRTAEVHGYTVTLAGEVKAGAESELTFTVRKGDRPVTDLQPYLEAYGHLVAIRAGDLAYLHVHPEGAPGDGTTEPGPGISFSATAPSRGDYRLFLDFRHRGTVRTAEFTVSANDAGSADETRHVEQEAGHGHGE